MSAPEEARRGAAMTLPIADVSSRLSLTMDVERLETLNVGEIGAGELLMWADSLPSFRLEDG